ncbi:hypothetical protein F511_04596 [Dorcoceras hygrometricum]|uniref:COP1-interacting protein 7 n=1 Tax=Dorcoceras hygrometricum TaxID=472368 RepID=A0A2Z7B753_9LAMI|nr:hypothetical protein F511_04596 [Dorcoceras hygrometricum]
MKSDAPLDYALFQLSPKRSRCELFVSSNGSTEKIASGLLKPFVAHLKVAENQVASAAQSVKLEVGQRKNAEVWFTKGTLERFVRFVSTPEVLELVVTFDSEMSQLEAARKIYSQGPGDQLSGGTTAAEDATKKELLRAIDVRLVAVQEDLSTACARAAAAGFNIDTISELQMFADKFGAHRLSEACCKLISLCERRPDLTNQWRPVSDDRIIRSSCGSDMSIDIDNLPSSPPTDQEQPATFHPSNTFPSFASSRTINRESSVEREAVEKKEGSSSTSDQISEPSVQASQPTRRLSVQDRINLFENKQKETSGGKPTVGKSSELRRMSSDVSSSGTMLLRRWSGASDMSLDLTAEKKDTECPSYSQSTASVSQGKQSEEKKTLNLIEKAVDSDSVMPEIKVVPIVGRVGDISELKGSSFNTLESNCNLDPVEDLPLREQLCNPTQSISFKSGGGHQDNQEEQRSLPGGKNVILGLGEQGKLKGPQNSEELSNTIEGVTSQTEVARVKDSSLTRSRHSGNRSGGQSKILNQREDSEIREQAVRQSRSKVNHKTLGESGLSDGGPGSKIREAFAARYKGNGGDSSSTHPDVKSVVESVGAEKKESHLSEKVTGNFVPNIENSGPHRVKSHKQGFAPDQSKKAEIQRDEDSSGGLIIGGPSSGKFSIDTEEIFDSFKTLPPEQAERKRQSKGNQELNDELMMKANELEKLFAEHKLRIPGDQSHSSSRGRPGIMQQESTTSSYHSKPVVSIGSQVSDSYLATEPNRSSKNTAKLDANSLTKRIENYGDAFSKEFSELSVSDGSRGKFYDRYTEKRDAKLREDWSSNRAEKEARLKSMQDSLERSKSDLKAKFSASEDRHDSSSNARRRAERLRSFNSRSIMKRKQQHLDFGDGEDDEEALNFPERNHLQEDVHLEHATFVDGVASGAQGKKLLPNNRTLSSSIGTSPIPGSRSAIRTSSTNSRRRRMQPENPLIQSVPNFSELRKENTKPSSGSSKTTRSQVRSYSRSKSASEEAAVVKDEKSSLRKSSINPNELRDVSPLDPDDAVLTQIKFDEEVPKTVAAKAFLRKGSRPSYVARANITKQKASVRPEPIRNEEGNNGLASGTDDFENTGKGEGEEEFETLTTEGHEVLDNEEPRPVMETEKFFDSGSENGDNKMIFSQLDKALGSQLTTVVPSGFHPVESMQDWPGESPISWKSHIQHSFYPHDLSDVDASVDSPVGSPASWNSQSLNQIESDAARMRKKWGTAQKPMLVANSSNNLSRKDMTRGFKRFLKFGRKTRGSENLVDWISATTSEGDDDTEDGRDPANRSSEDLRKSRMGFSQAQPADDSFNESEFFNEQVQPSQSAIPEPPANFKLREDQISGSSIKDTPSVPQKILLKVGRAVKTGGFLSMRFHC